MLLSPYKILSTTSKIDFVIGENVKPDVFLGKEKNDVNNQRLNKSYDHILCLSSIQSCKCPKKHSKLSDL